MHLKRQVFPSSPRRQSFRLDCSPPCTAASPHQPWWLRVPWIPRRRRAMLATLPFLRRRASTCPGSRVPQPWTRRPRRPSRPAPPPRQIATHPLRPPSSPCRSLNCLGTSSALGALCDLRRLIPHPQVFYEARDCLRCSWYLCSRSCRCRSGQFAAQFQPGDMRSCVLCSLS